MWISEPARTLALAALTACGGDSELPQAARSGEESLGEVLAARFVLAEEPVEGFLDLSRHLSHGSIILQAPSLPSLLLALHHLADAFLALAQLKMYSDPLYSFKTCKSASLLDPPLPNHGSPVTSSSHIAIRAPFLGLVAFVREPRTQKKCKGYHRASKEQSL